MLVGGADLPAPGELPEPLRPLATRQAVALRDATWHQDVDALVRRLEGEELIESPRRRGLGGRGLWRRWPVVVGAAVALIASGLGGWIWLADDDTGDADSSGDELTGCPTPDSSWPNVEVVEQAPTVENSGPYTYAYTVHDFYYQLRAPDPTEVIVRVELANETTAVPDTANDSIYYSGANFETLFVDGISQNEPSCFSIVSGGRNVDPGKARSHSWDSRAPRIPQTHRWRSGRWAAWRSRSPRGAEPGVRATGAPTGSRRRAPPAS